ncbi:hypothetical protein BH20BAC1_BH20BAC1_28560 [soil metagenome]
MNLDHWKSILRKGIVFKTEEEYQLEKQKQ